MKRGRQSASYLNHKTMRNNWWMALTWHKGQRTTRMERTRFCGRRGNPAAMQVQAGTRAALRERAAKRGSRSQNDLNPQVLLLKVRNAVWRANEAALRAQQRRGWNGCDAKSLVVARTAAAVRPGTPPRRSRRACLRTWSSVKVQVRCCKRAMNKASSPRCNIPPHLQCRVGQSSDPTLPGRNTKL